MKNFIKKLLLFIIIICLLGALGFFGYLSFVDIQASVAKEYLIERYGFDKRELTAIKSTEYVYEDITNCETLWLKKCSDDKTLHYKHIFKLKDGTEISVTEDIERNFIDNYDGTVINYNRKEEQKEQGTENTLEDPTIKEESN